MREVHILKRPKKKKASFIPPWTEAGSRDTHRPSSKGIRQTRPANHGLKLAGSPLQPLTVTQSRISPPVNFPKRWEPFQRHLHSTIGVYTSNLARLLVQLLPMSAHPHTQRNVPVYQEKQDPTRVSRGRLPLPPCLLDEQEYSNALNTSYA